MAEAVSLGRDDMLSFYLHGFPLISFIILYTGHWGTFDNYTSQTLWSWKTMLIWGLNSTRRIPKFMGRYLPVTPFNLCWFRSSKVLFTINLAVDWRFLLFLCPFLTNLDPVVSIAEWSNLLYLGACGLEK